MKNIFSNQHFLQITKVSFQLDSKKSRQIKTTAVEFMVFPWILGFAEGKSVKHTKDAFRENPTRKSVFYNEIGPAALIQRFRLKNWSTSGYSFACEMVDWMFHK